MNCVVCRDEGAPGGCEACGKDSLLPNKEVVLTPEILESCSVPEQYLGKTWNVEELKRSHSRYLENDNFLRYCGVLDRCYLKFVAGSLPMRSAFIMAPRGYGKRIFAYSCMQAALSHGYKVAPIIDNMQYKRLCRLSSDRPFSKAIQQMDPIETYHSADVMFLTIDVSNYLEAFPVMDSLVDKRSRLGKSTFILSRFSLAKLAYYERDDAWKHFLNNGRQPDSFKHPSSYIFTETN